MNLPIGKCGFCKELIIWAEEQPNPKARTKQEVKLVPFDAGSNDHALFVLTSIPGKKRPVFGMMKNNQAAGYRASGGKTFQKHSKTCTKWPQRTAK